MDNRLRFLYCGMKEMWGHGQKAWAGNGKTGASEVGAREANPSCESRRRDAERKKSSEAGRLAVKKSRYKSYRTRTVNRHRWMRRES